MATKIEIIGDRSKILNFNIGVLGHIDSGKTSLAKALSTVASTASFDKNPQSKERGITLDLGFSSFTIPIPDRLKDSGYEHVQFTLVDCPGHASLIRTIIGGAQIIDLMMLVIDITKGIQTQTAECLVIGEITCRHMVVVLNKVDLLEDSKRETQITKMSKRIAKTLENTRFKGAAIVSVAAKPGGPEAPETESAVGVDHLVQVLSDHLFVPYRSPDGPLIYSVDHCFPIKGQGTVMTGTVLKGSVNVNDNVEIPFMKVTKKVKSMQMFHKPVHRAIQGDRVGICVTQFDPKAIERCLVCSPGCLPTIYAGIFKVSKVQYHKMPCLTGAKLHISIGHETLMAKVTFFGTRANVPEETFDFEIDYPFQQELHDNSQLSKLQESEPGAIVGATADVIGPPVHQFALLEFEKPVTCSPSAVVIGSRLDVDAFSNTCRIALHGILLVPITDRDYDKTVLPRLKVYKIKSREGVVERAQDERLVIGKGLFKRETKIHSFVGLNVYLSTGEVAVIESAFGTTGKFRLTVPNGLKPETLQLLQGTGKKKGRAKENQQDSSTTPQEPHQSVKIYLQFKRYVFDPDKRMKQ